MHGLTTRSHPSRTASGRRMVASMARLEAMLVVAAACLVVMVGRDGTPVWRAGRIVAVLAVFSGSVAVMPRVDAQWRGRLAVVVGVLAAPIGLGFAPFLVKGGDRTVALASVLLTSSGLALAVAGAIIATTGLRLARRIGTGLATSVAAALAAFVVGPAVAATNVPRPSIGETPVSVGLAYESARLETSDQVDLAAWYVPSANRAAVVLLHGAGSTRSNVLAQAAVLARGGYGVLLVDARGHGESAGRAMDFGWHGDEDIAAATAFLSRRADVDPSRIGVVGLSMGGEQALGATARNPLIRAVVAEGATARNAEDEAWLSDAFGLRGAFQEQLERVQDWVTDRLTSASVPVSLRTAVASAQGTHYLLIAAGNVADEGRAAAYLAAAAPDRVEVWTVVGSGHTGGLKTAPDEWDRRVTTFLDAALGSSA